MVRIEGVPAACTALYVPFLACAQPVSLPLTLNVLNMNRSVFFGASAADILGAAIKTAISIGIEACFPEGSGQDFSKALCSCLGGFIASVAQHAVDPRYPVSAKFSMKYGNGMEATVGFTAGSTDKTNNPTEVSVAVTKNLLNDDTKDDKAGRSATVGGKLTYTIDAADPKKEGGKVEASAGVGTAAAGGDVKVAAERHSDGGIAATGTASGQSGVVGGDASAKAESSDNSVKPIDGKSSGWGPKL